MKYPGIITYLSISGEKLPVVVSQQESAIKKGLEKQAKWIPKYRRPVVPYIAVEAQ